jgi:O-antigen ligase
MLIGVPAYLGFKLWIWLFSIESGLTFRTAFASLMFFAVPAMLASAAPFAPAVIDHSLKETSAMMEKNNQAENRFKLWREALTIGIEANMLGLGPGPHLVHKQWKRPPPDKFEAHNTLLDLFTQGGIVASLSFLWLIATAFFVACRAGLIALTILPLSLFVFSNFHFIARHPIFWFSVAFCLAAGEGIRRMSSRCERSG